MCSESSLPLLELWVVHCQWRIPIQPPPRQIRRHQLHRNAPSPASQHQVHPFPPLRWLNPLAPQPAIPRAMRRCSPSPLTPRGLGFDGHPLHLAGIIFRKPNLPPSLVQWFTVSTLFKAVIENCFSWVHRLLPFSTNLSTLKSLQKNNWHSKKVPPVTGANCTNSRCLETNQSLKKWTKQLNRSDLRLYCILNFSAMKSPPPNSCDGISATFWFHSMAAMEPSASPLGGTNSEVWQLFSKTWIGSRFWRRRIHSLHPSNLATWTYPKPPDFCKKNIQAAVGGLFKTQLNVKQRFTSLSPSLWKVRTASFAWFGAWCDKNRAMIGIPVRKGSRALGKEKRVQFRLWFRAINSHHTKLRNAKCPRVVAQQDWHLEHLPLF